MVSTCFSGVWLEVKAFCVLSVRCDLLNHSFYAMMQCKKTLVLVLQNKMSSGFELKMNTYAMLICNNLGKNRVVFTVI